MLLGQAVEDRWWGSPIIFLYNDNRRLLALVPSSFLISSRTNTWSYLTDVTEDVVGPFKSVPLWSDMETGQPVDQGQVPQPGSYTLRLQAPTASVPDMMVPYPITLSETGSERSLSSRTSQLRSEVRLRDQDKCFVTGRQTHHNQAAHLVPRAWGEQRFADITGLAWVGVDNVRCALMLDPTIHRMYDGYEMGLLPMRRASMNPDDDDVPPPSSTESDRWVVHLFLPPSGGTAFDDLYRALHGKVIEVPHSSTAPFAKLAREHYKKCVRIRFGKNPRPEVPTRTRASSSATAASEDSLIDSLSIDSPQAKRQRRA